MNNGSTDYLDQYHHDQITAAGAAGVFTVNNIPNGDPINNLNNQKYDSGDLSIIANQWAFVYNTGEFGINGNQFKNPAAE